MQPYIEEIPIHTVAAQPTGTLIVSLPADAQSRIQRRVLLALVTAKIARVSK